MSESTRKRQRLAGKTESGSGSSRRGSGSRRAPVARTRTVMTRSRTRSQSILQHEVGPPAVNSKLTGKGKGRVNGQLTVGCPKDESIPSPPPNDASSSHSLTTQDIDDADSEPPELVLTSEYIRGLDNEQELVSNLGLVFSDPCTLGRSFPQTDPLLASVCPVDVTDVEEAYKFMLCESSESITEELRLWTVATVSMLNTDPCHEHDNQLNTLLILLLNPKIAEYVHPTDGFVFPDLCNIILSLTAIQQNTLISYFAKGCFDSAKEQGTRKQEVSSRFTKLVNMFQDYITREVTKAAHKPDTSAEGSSSDTVIQKVCLHSLHSSSITLVLRCLSLINNYNNTNDLVPYEVFYNSAVNEYMDVKEDFPRFRLPEGISFCNYPFLLSPTTKSEVIKVESILYMRTELQDSFFRAMFSGVTCPYLVLEVRRDNLVRDTLYQLNLKLSQDLRKQLKVRFVGEEGVDEGGVQKEFFQLIVRDVFLPKYGMFKLNEESQYYWFEPCVAPEKDALEEIRLTGQLIGLAVYNTVILDIHFPLALYKKLLGVPITRSDLETFDPVLYRGLTQICNISSEDIDSLERTFEIEYEELGAHKAFELISKGSRTQLTIENRNEFVEKYIDFIFNKSCDLQFKEFKAGFDRICGNSFVRLMRPEELELLVCGSSDLDFTALESSTLYDGGYTKETKVIKNFWSVVRGFSDELKRKLLFFTTSSDRVPIGGLSKLHFVIAKNGGDSDRLPTSHTCFNVLLLPEYSTIEKLRERLLTAIHNSEGFGMI